MKQGMKQVLLWGAAVALVVVMFAPSLARATDNGGYDTFGKFCDRGGSSSSGY